MRPSRNGVPGGSHADEPVHESIGRAGVTAVLASRAARWLWPRDLRRERAKITLVGVGHERVTEIALPPRDDVKAAKRHDRAFGRANGDRSGDGPVQAIGAKHEERDLMQAALEDERGGLAIDR